MEILTENNAFQNIAKCLQQECTDHSQIEDFLQYCIELLFYEKTHIAGTVPPNVIQDSENIINILKDQYSIDNIDFENIKDDTEEADSLIDNISFLLDSGLDELLKKLKEIQKDEILKYLPNLTPDSMELIKNTTRAISEKNEKVLCDEYLSSSTFSRDSCFFKIINYRRAIIDKIFKFSEKYEWNEAMTMRLLTEIRLLSNKELARTNKHIYLPSIKRGRIDKLNRIKPEDIPERIDTLIFKAGKLLNDEEISLSGIPSIEMPSIKDYIIRKGKGNPSDILKFACDLREKFTPLRNYISGNKGSTIEHISKINEIANNIYHMIKNGPLDKSKLVIENAPVLNVAIISQKIPIPDWNKIVVYTCVEVFTEVMDDMMFTHDSEYEKLLSKNCMKG